MAWYAARAARASAHRRIALHFGGRVRTAETRAHDLRRIDEAIDRCDSVARSSSGRIERLMRLLPATVRSDLVDLATEMQARLGALRSALEGQHARAAALLQLHATTIDYVHALALTPSRAESNEPSLRSRPALLDGAARKAATALLLPGIRHQLQQVALGNSSARLEAQWAAVQPAQPSPQAIAAPSPDRGAAGISVKLGGYAADRRDRRDDEPQGVEELLQETSAGLEASSEDASRLEEALADLACIPKPDARAECAALAAMYKQLDASGRGHIDALTGFLRTRVAEHRAVVTALTGALRSARLAYDAAFAPSAGPVQAASVQAVAKAARRLYRRSTKLHGLTTAMGQILDATLMRVRDFAFSEGHELAPAARMRGGRLTALLEHVDAATIASARWLITNQERMLDLLAQGAGVTRTRHVPDSAFDEELPSQRRAREARVGALEELVAARRRWDMKRTLLRDTVDLDPTYQLRVAESDCAKFGLLARGARVAVYWSVDPIVGRAGAWYEGVVSGCSSAGMRVTYAATEERAEETDDVPVAEMEQGNVVWLAWTEQMVRHELDELRAKLRARSPKPAYLVLRDDRESDPDLERIARAIKLAPKHTRGALREEGRRLVRLRESGQDD
jgi:hypothetical protein